MLPADHGDPGAPAARAAATTSTRQAGPRRSASRRTATQTLHRRAGRLRGGRARHPEAAAPDEGRGRPAAALRPARLPDPHQLRVDPRRDRARHRRSTTARASRSRPRSTPTSTPTSSRCATARAATRWRCCRPCSPTATGHVPRWRTWLQGAVDAEGATSRDLYDLKHWSERTVIALVMQTLDNSITTYPKRSRAPAGLAADLAAGPRRAQPDLDPGRATRPYAGWPTMIGGTRRRRRSASRSTCR